MDSDTRKRRMFETLNEIGIIQQLATTEFNRRMPDGLHISHFGVINHLCRLGNGRTPLGIANAFQVTKATMSHTLARLSDRGLVELKQNPDDGRSKLVYLTARGRVFHERAIAAVAPALETMDENLDLEKIIAMLPTLRELRAYLDNNRGA